MDVDAIAPLPKAPTCCLLMLLFIGTFRGGKFEFFWHFGIGCCHREKPWFFGVGGKRRVNRDVLGKRGGFQFLGGIGREGVVVGGDVAASFAELHFVYYQRL
jgi:hypothetical protein